MILGRAGRNRCTGCTSDCEDGSGSGGINSLAAVAEVALFWWLHSLICLSAPW